MEQSIEAKIEEIIVEQLYALNRSDLYRRALVSFSAADDTAYAALKKIVGEWHLTPTELLPEAESVISYFVPFTKEVACAPRTTKDGSPLWGEAYEEINKHFNTINQAVTAWLSGRGYRTLTIQPTHTYDPKDLKCLWSHRSAAVISGLGSFAANHLVITEKGSGGRFCTILTSAVLRANKPPVETKCLYMRSGSCGLCFKVCPVQALSPQGFDKFACQDALNRNEALLRATTHLQSADVCGKCISVCPFSYIE